MADVYSRRLSIDSILGTSCSALGWRCKGSCPNFGVILLAQAIWGSAIPSRAARPEAWLTDESRRGAAGALFLRALADRARSARSWPSPSRPRSATSSLRLPILIGGGLYVALGFRADHGDMPEHGFTPAPPRGANVVARDGRHNSGTALTLIRPLTGPAHGSSASWRIDLARRPEAYDRLNTDRPPTRNFTFPAFHDWQAGRLARRDSASSQRLRNIGVFRSHPPPSRYHQPPRRRPHTDHSTALLVVSATSPLRWSAPRPGGRRLDSASGCSARINDPLQTAG